MNRILLSPDEIGSDGRIALSGAKARHVLEVLHVSAGDEVRVGMINGVTGMGLVERVEKSCVCLKCTMDGEVPPVPVVDLMLALPRPKAMKRLWPQLAAIGVGRVVIVNAAKVERNYFDTKWLDSRHYEPLLIDGLMQSGDTRLPEVLIRRRLKPFVEDELGEMFPSRSRFVFHPGCAPAMKIFNAGKTGRMLVALGPEGGWTDFELDLLRKHGFLAVGMGQRILRSDTACISALVLAHGFLS